MQRDRFLLLWWYFHCQVEVGLGEADEVSLQRDNSDDIDKEEEKEEDGDDDDEIFEISMERIQQDQLEEDEREKKTLVTIQIMKKTCLV